MKQLTKLGLVLMGAGICTGAWAGREAIQTEQPVVWYAFDNSANGCNVSSGSAVLTFSNSTVGSWGETDDRGGGYIIGNGSACPHGGSGFPCGTGSWTCLTRAKVSSTANSILLCIGGCRAGEYGVVVYSGGAGKVKVSILEGLANYSGTLTIDVPDASSVWHDYALAFDLADMSVDVLVDGVSKGKVPHPNYNRNNTPWQWFSMYGGLGTSGLTVGDAGMMIDDYRVYQRVLKPAELVALHEGRTQVPVFGGFAAAADIRVWRNVALKDVVRFHGKFGGTSINKQWGVPFYLTQTAESASVQMHLDNDAAYDKAVKVTFTQDGADVKAKATWGQGRYLQVSGGGGIYANQGNDFDIQAGSGMSLAVGNQAGGYGLSQLTADLLTDGGAAVYDEGAWTPAAPVAAQPVSFRSGTGTWENTAVAGTAFGPLAFGVASGSWTVTGNAASFTDVVNASSAAQTIAIPLAFAGDFKPQTQGQLTFTDLQVGGTFQPSGIGEIHFAGETSIAVADVRYNTRTADSDPDLGKGGSAWTNYKGYYDNNKQQVFRLVTDEGSHTTIGELIPLRAGQRWQALYLKGDFTVGGNYQTGNDAWTVIESGNVTFTEGYNADASLGVNANFMVKEGATWNLSRITSTSKFGLTLAGTINAGNVAGSTGAGVYVNGNGTFNADRINGPTYSVGATFGPEESFLGIGGTVNFSGCSATTQGVTFRTTSASGAPARIEMTGTLTPNAIPLAITGGGTFTYKNAGALTFASLTVGADTKADFSACSALTLTASSLAAGSTLVLPEWDGTAAIFAAKPTLPSEGVVTLVLPASASLVPGTYALGAGFTADDLDHLAVAFTGANGAGFQSALAVTDGTLNLTVTRAPKGCDCTALLTCSGYKGTSTLENFPVLVKLPEGVPGFSYIDAAANGADLWFADAAGNRIAHEIDTWNASGSSYVWVRVPRIESAATTFRIHWGAGASSVPALADTKTFDDRFLGVWHFSSFDNTTPDSSPLNLVMTVQGTKANLSLNSASPVGTCMYSTGGAYFTTPNAASWLAYATTKKLTLSGWVKTTSTTANLRIISNKISWDSAGGFEVTTRGSAATELLAGGSNNAQYTKSGLASYKDNWMHFTVVYDGTLATPESRMYINGVYQTKATGANYGPQTKSDPLALFATPNGVNPFLGSLDEIRMAKVVESDDWIRAAYDTSATPTAFATAGGVEFASARYDFRALTAPNTVTENTGCEPVFAGVETTLTLAGSGALTIEADKKAVVPGWDGTVQNLGWLKTTRSSQETVAPISGTTEYAASHVLSFTNPAHPLVFSGDVLVTEEKGLFAYLESPVTVTGGTTTFASATGITRFAEESAAAGGTYGARLIITGGLVQAQKTTLDYSGYEDREMSITMTGGKFTVPMRAWAVASGVDLTNCTVNVGGTGVFAPESISWRNPGTTHCGTFRYFVTLQGNGRFTTPATGVPNWVRVTVGDGTPHMGSPANGEAEFGGVLTIPAGKTLSVDGENETVILTGIIDGEGTLEVGQGGVLDLSDPDGDVEDFTGTLVVKNGGVLILPAGAVPPFTLKLEDGARVIATVENGPAGTAAFLGALAATPESGTATIEFDLPQSVPQGAIYTLSTATLPAGAADTLAIVFTGAAGESTQGTIAQDGEGHVTVTVTQSAAAGALEWAGVTDETITSDAAVLAWQQKGSEDATKYPFMANLPIWFTDLATLTTVNVADANLKPASVNINTTKTYDLRGEKLDAATVVKDGSGTFIVNGKGFVAPESVTVKAGTLKLGDAAVKGALGPETTTITIEDGATLDLNTRIPTENDTNRGAVIYDNPVIITGDGVDGKGAIWDSNPVPNSWQFHLGHVVMVGDASIGGTSRVEFRRPGTATTTDRASIKGDDDATLTVKVQVPEDANQGLNFYVADINVGKIVVDENASMGYEGETTATVPHGIELKSGARLQFWNAAGKKAPVEVTGTDARIKASSTANNVQDAPVTVRSDASVNLYGDQKLTYKDSFLNEGTVTTSGGTHLLAAAVTNNGAVVVSGGNLQFAPTSFVGQASATINGGALWFDNSTDWSSTSFAFTMTSGNLWWGIGAGFPNATEANLDVTGITGGAIRFLANGDQTIPGKFIEAKPASIFVYNNQAGKSVTLPAGTWEISDMLSIGTSTYGGYLKLASGTTVTVPKLYLADENNSAKPSVLEVGPGSEITATSEAVVGRWSGVSSSYHEVRVTGGTLNVPNSNFITAYDAPFCFVTMTAGKINAKGLSIRDRVDYPITNECFTMTSGELDLGSNGIISARHRYEGLHADFAGGTYKATANHSISRYGLIAAMGENMLAEGEGLTIDLNGKTVDHSRTPHFGASDVTIKGSGAYTTASDWQGVVHGKWTVDTESDATVNLTGVAGFAGGLELKPNTTASIGISGEGGVEYGYLPLAFDAAYTHVSTNGPLPSVMSHIKKIHTEYASGAPVNSCSFGVRGQFLVPEGDAGVWTFAGNFDDNIGLWIDGTQVFKSASWTAIGRGERDLTAGWHDFIIIAYDGTGGQGPCQGNWKSKKSIGWRKGSSTSTEANDYNIFDSNTLKFRTKPLMRSDSSVTVYRKAGTSFGTYAALSAIDDSTWGTPYAKGTTLQATLNTKVEALQKSSAQRYVGGFMVDAAHAGTWTFYGSWDDSIILKIDGKEVLHNTAWDALATVTHEVAAGYHTFDIRTADGSGGYGPDAKGINGGMGLAVMRPGDAAKLPFDERTIAITASAQQAQKVTPTGIAGTVMVGEGATLANGSPWDAFEAARKDGHYCPIWGTLEGKGTLSGLFRFAGEQNSWKLAADHRHITGKVAFGNPDAAMLAGLKQIELEFSDRPVATKFEVCDALGLTAETAADIVVKAPIPAELRKPSDGDEFEFTATVRDGKLVLINEHPVNGTAIFLR